MKSEHARLCATAKSRAHLVEQCRTLALDLGCTFQTTPSILAPRSMTLMFGYGPYLMSTRFDGDSRCGAFIGHWYIGQGKTNATFPASFANVNPCHRRKATTCADGFEDFLDWHPPRLYRSQTTGDCPMTKLETRREDILDDLQSIAENGERSVGEVQLLHYELELIESQLADKDATVTTPEACRILTRLGAPPDTERARMIRQRGLEAVAKALDTSPH